VASEVFLVALVTDIATGLGVLPLAIFDRRSARWPGLAAGFAGGMMLLASVFALADKALRRGDSVEVVGGTLAGAAFFAVSARIIAGQHWQLHERGSIVPARVGGAAAARSEPRVCRWRDDLSGCRELLPDSLAVCSREETA
jgi:zinc transporter ZupT